MEIANIFSDAFDSATTIRRNVMATKKIALCSIKSGKQESFCEDIKACVLVLLTAKKGTGGVEKVLKFLKAFFEYAFDESIPDAGPLKILASYLVEFLLFDLSKGFQAKDKIVRFRVCQIVGFLFEFLEELDDDLLNSIVDHLYKRTFDKEPIVRAHALIALTAVMVRLSHLLFY